MFRFVLVGLALIVAVGPAMAEPRRVDPAVEQFWSDRCVQQRRDRRPHTKDCDNPAYTGGYRGPPAYRHPPPYDRRWVQPQWPRTGPDRGWSRPSGVFRYPSFAPREP